MPNQNQDNEMPEITKRLSWRVWLAAIIVVLTAIVLYLLWSQWYGKSVDERLAEIEAAHSIPDSENAAVVYNQLLQDPYPAGVKEHQYIIDKLMEATRLENCRFPIIAHAESTPTQMDRLSAMKRWALLLVSTANNDLADGRIDDAIRKWRSLLQMGNHLRQQPLFVEYLVACAVEAIGLNDAAVFAVEGNATNTHLNQIEAMPLHTADRWAAVLEEILPVEEVVGEKRKEQLGLLDRIKYEFGSGLLGRAKERDTERIREVGRRLLTTSRGLHILVALRRYRNKHGRWPRNLDEIQSQLPAEVLVDPSNNGPFLYKLTEDSFELYSIGKNNIDENGKYKRGPDDWPIWPPHERKPKAEEKNVNLQLPDPNIDQKQ